MTINGEAVVEADYGSLHASILYNQAGIPFSGDAYDIDGFERTEVKLGFNIAINAKNRAAAVAALAHHLGKSWGHCAKIVEAIQRRHKPIQQHFCSDAGVRLMRIDADLILSALRGMHGAGEPALPIHDALMVPARCAPRAADLMVQSFERIVGRASQCTVNIKRGPVAGLVGIEGGVVSEVINLESSGVGAPDRRPRHDQQYHEDAFPAV